MNASHSTSTGPVNAVCTVFAKIVVPLLDRLAEHAEKSHA